MGYALLLFAYLLRGFNNSVVLRAIPLPAAAITDACSIIGAVVMLVVLMFVFHKGEESGKSDDRKATIETQKRIDDADAHGPRTPDDVDKRLRDGKF